MYYNYHGIIQKKIREQKLIDMKYYDEYHGIKNALVLSFNDGTSYPIREEKQFYYLVYIEQKDLSKQFVNLVDSHQENS